MISIRQTLTAENIQPIILCGGSGTRLWPLSRQSLPKQFVPLIGGKSLLQLTFERVKGLSDQPITVVTHEDHRYLVNDVASLDRVNYQAILEPIARNTAAAITAAALNAETDKLLLFLPADHHVPDVDQFICTMREGIDAANSGAIVTFGVKPSSPHTGYGYIQVEQGSASALSVKRFVEKPNLETAIEYVAEGHYYWNAGIFLARADTILSAMAAHASDILSAVKKANARAVVDGDVRTLDKLAFSQARSDSIDYAVLEHHDNIRMVPFDGVWSDVGSWQVVAQFSNADPQGNRIHGQGYCVQSTDTYIHSEHRPVVTLGVENLLVVDTRDAVLVAASSHAEQVKEVVSLLNEQALPQATEHRHMMRPWGQFDSVDEGQGFKVKRLTVKPGERLSLQRHQQRAEHWVVVKGIAEVQCGDNTFTLNENESTYIPIGEMHRLSNPGSGLLEIIEVQSGNYLGEDDIERFDDNYGRLVKGS